MTTDTIGTSGETFTERQEHEINQLLDALKYYAIGCTDRGAWAKSVIKQFNQFNQKQPCTLINSSKAST